MLLHQPQLCTRFFLMLLFPLLANLGIMLRFAASVEILFLQVHLLLKGHSGLLFGLNFLEELCHNTSTLLQETRIGPHPPRADDRMGSPIRYLEIRSSLRLCLDVDIEGVGIELDTIPNQPGIGNGLQCQSYCLDVRRIDPSSLLISIALPDPSYNCRGRRRDRRSLGKRNAELGKRSA